MCLVLKRVQLHIAVATCMNQLLCHTSRQDDIESDRIKSVCVYVCVCGGGGCFKLIIIMYISCAADLEPD